MINGEEIITTETHPFYVNNRGFVNAGELKVDDELLDSNGNTLLIESYEIELTDEPTTVYNFQVEDFHTYYVGENGVLVHNAEYNDSNTKVNDVLKDKNIKKTKSKSLLQFDDISGKGYSKALNDFNHLECSNTKPINVSSGGKGVIGYLDDGRSVIVRQTSTTSGPTLEIQFKSNRRIKIRY